MRRRYRLSCSPNEEGKAGQDNEHSPEKEDAHTCSIRRSLPPFKVPSAGVILTGRTGVPDLRSGKWRKIEGEGDPLADLHLWRLGPRHSSSSPKACAVALRLLSKVPATV